MSDPDQLDPTPEHTPEHTREHTSEQDAAGVRSASGARGEGGRRRRPKGAGGRGSPPDAGRPSGRRVARERALGLLYEAETKGRPISEVLAALPSPPDTYARQLVEGVEAHGARLDELISRNAHGWRLERMALIDLCVTRMAVFELTSRPDVPTAAVLSEAVELAKRFSTDNSGRFVNGLLAAIATEVRPGVDPTLPVPMDLVADRSGSSDPLPEATDQTVGPSAEEFPSDEPDGRPDSE